MIRKKIWALYCVTVLMLLSFILTMDRAVTTMASGEKGRNCIIIDPGHGGEDGGATSITGRLESDYNLEIALRLNDLFQLLGYDTRMIRTTDTAIYTKGETLSQKKISDLKERTRVANETPNSFLISIHQNTFSDPQYSGAQVFYGEGERSLALARQLQDALIQGLNPGSNRKCKKASGIYLMEHISCPGVLIECGFLSNDREARLLSEPDYQKRLCCVIAATTAAFLSNA